MKTNLRTR